MRRRSFIKSAAVAASTFSIVPRHVLGGPKHVPPSEKVNVALVGCGGRGRKVLRGMMDEADVRVLAVADPAASFSLQNFYYKDVGGREPTRQLIEDRYKPDDANYECRSYVDFEEMLDTEKELDAVICGTPDHLHAYVSAKCLNAGKHVYCEKPLTHNIWEANQISALAKKAGLATQLGNQGHSTDGMRDTVEWLRAGAIGEVEAVEVWVSGTRWNPSLSDKPEGNMQVPKGLEWDRWIGPRDERAYHSAYFPVAWRDFWAFGNSNIGDFGCHDMDAACWALELGEPTSVDFTPAGPCNSEIGPHGCIGHYEFPENARHSGVNLTWYDGGLKPAVPPGWPTGEPLPSRGVLFHGTEGVMFCGGAGGAPRLLDESVAAEFKAPQKEILRVESHARDWLDAIHGKGPAGSNFEYGAKLTKLALLGALSLRTGSRIEWDAKQQRATGLPEADKIIKESYRDGWLVG